MIRELIKKSEQIATGDFTRKIFLCRDGVVVESVGTFSVKLCGEFPISDPIILPPEVVRVIKMLPESGNVEISFNKDGNLELIHDSGVKVVSEFTYEAPSFFGEDLDKITWFESDLPTDFSDYCKSAYRVASKFKTVVFKTVNFENGFMYATDGNRAWMAPTNISKDRKFALPAEVALCVSKFKFDKIRFYDTPEGTKVVELDGSECILRTITRPLSVSSENINNLRSFVETVECVNVQEMLDDIKRLDDAIARASALDNYVTITCNDGNLTVESTSTHSKFNESFWFWLGVPNFVIIVNPQLLLYKFHECDSFAVSKFGEINVVVMKKGSESFVYAGVIRG